MPSDGVPDEIVPELLNSVMVPWLWFMKALLPIAVEIEALLVTVKSHNCDEFSCVVVTFVLMTVLPLHPLAQAALFVK